MNKRRLNMILAALTIVAALPQANTFAAPLKPPSNFADPAFKGVWERTDSLVDSGKVKRSWFWGPSAGFTTMEEYDQGPGGKHLVQYFDKSRMEINNPNGDKNHPFYVTNGLLTTELITGKVQMGNDRFVLRWPAEIPLASDSDDKNAPTYATFRGAMARKDSYLVGKTVTSIVDKSGQWGITNDGDPDSYYAQFKVRYVYFETATNHNIPDVFWNFLNDTGPVMNDNAQLETARLNDPYFYATGFPITDAYWASVKIEGKESTPVLIQPYQRRVLTYVPSAPAGFKVQMGNIGQHYYDWRYKDAGKPASLSGKCESYPKFGFGKLYHDRPEVAIALGCGDREEVRRTVERQKFERGEVIGIIYFDDYTGYYFEDVHVLLSDGTVDGRLLLQARVDSQSPPPTPTLGTIPSPSNFDYVLGQYNSALRRRVGAAIAPAELVKVERDSNGKVTGGIPVQYFTGGFMVYPNLAERKIYVLYNTSGIAHSSPSPHLHLVIIDRWSVYDDAFQP